MLPQSALLLHPQTPAVLPLAPTQSPGALVGQPASDKHEMVPAVTPSQSSWLVLLVMLNVRCVDEHPGVGSGVGSGVGLEEELPPPQAWVNPSAAPTRIVMNMPDRMLRVIGVPPLNMFKRDHLNKIVRVVKLNFVIGVAIIRK